MNNNNLSLLQYDFLECKNSDFTTESLKRLKALLTIRKEGNVIYLSS